MDKLEDAPVATRVLKRQREDLDSLLPPPVDPLRDTLFLDMDGTLLAGRSQMVPQDEGSEYFEVTRKQDGIEQKTYVYTRPSLQPFLTVMSELYEVVVFTLSRKKRADRFLDEIDPDRQLIKFRLYRDSAKHGVKDLSWLGRDLRKVIIIDDKSKSTKHGVKDLSWLGRDLRKVIIIDDKPRSYQLQKSNAIPIKRFDGLKSDSELTQRIPLLRNLRNEEEVRPKLAEKFQVHDPRVSDVGNAQN